MGILPLHDIGHNEQPLQYFTGELRDGISLARRANAKIDFTKGRFIVALPEGADLAALPEFDSPGNCNFASAGHRRLHI